MTLLLWALCGASLVYWGLRLGRPAELATLTPLVQPALAINATALAQALGAGSSTPPPVPVAGTPALELRGVLAGTRSGQGTALIAIGGKPPKPYRVGAQVTDALLLQSLGRREARLGAARDSATTLTLELPHKP